jgi:hypothetical protein
MSSDDTWSSDVATRSISSGSCPVDGDTRLRILSECEYAADFARESLVRRADCRRRGPVADLDGGSDQVSSGSR